MHVKSTFLSSELYIWSKIYFNIFQEHKVENIKVIQIQLSWYHNEEKNLIKIVEIVEKKTSLK